MTTTVRTTVLEVRVTPQSGPDAGTPTLDPTAYAVSCSFGFDQRYAEATIRRTGGGTLTISYWDQIEVRMGTTPGEGAGLRFRGFIIPVENQLFPIEGTLQCRGYLYRAAWVKNQEPEGTQLSDPATGVSDQEQVKAVLTACAVPHTASNIGGTGKALGLRYLDLGNILGPSPFVWQHGQSGLDYIEQLDQVSVPDPPPLGCYRTFETLGGDVFRILLVTNPETAADFTFTEGVDVLEARITRDPTGAANRVTVTGAPDPTNPTVTPDPDSLEVGFTIACSFTATNPNAPYLPAGLPPGAGTVSPEHPAGYPVVGAAFASPMIEKSFRVDPDHPENVISCQSVADYLLGEYNCVLDTLEFSTPRDDLLGPGQTIHLHSPRLGLTDPTRHYWLQHLDVDYGEDGAFTQRLRLVRKS